MTAQIRPAIIVPRDLVGKQVLLRPGERNFAGQALERLLRAHREYPWTREALDAAISQYLQPLLLQSIFGGGAAQSQWTGNATVYIGVSTAAFPTTDALLKSGEPTSAGSYGRIVVTNNVTNFPAATGSNPATSKLHIAFAFAVSTAAWSTGASPLQSFFIADAATLAGGNVLWSGALVPATDIVNGAGVTLSFAIDALQFTLT